MKSSLKYRLNWLIIFTTIGIACRSIASSYSFMDGGSEINHEASVQTQNKPKPKPSEEVCDSLAEKSLKQVVTEEKSMAKDKKTNQLSPKPSVSKAQAGVSKPINQADKVKKRDCNKPIYLVPNQFPFTKTEDEKESKPK